MILLIDNYDSFVYNLYQFMAQTDPDVRIVRNDRITLQEISEMNPDLIVLSPGPGRPEDAGICISLVQNLKGKIPIFGVCLGHQAICSAFGAVVTYAKELMHGKQSIVRFDRKCPLFQGCPETAPVARYHSLAADENTIPEELQVTAVTEEGEVMAVSHREYPIYGVQFHPESIYTEHGKRIVENFICADERSLQ